MDLVEIVDLTASPSPGSSSIENTTENSSQTMVDEVELGGITSFGDYSVSEYIDHEKELGVHIGQLYRGVACLIAIGKHFLPGYHPETVKRIGGGFFAGLWSEAKLGFSEFGEESIILVIGISNCNRHYTLARVIIPLARIQFSLSFEDFETTLSDDSIMGVLTAYPSFPTKLKHSPVVTKDLWIKPLLRPGPKELKGFVIDEFPGTFIQRIAHRVRSLQVDVDATALIICPGPRFDELRGRFNQEVYDFQGAIDDVLDEIKGTVAFDICFRPDEDPHALSP